jgi:hypothetical protein
VVQPRDRTHDVDDGIHGADLVELDRIGRDAVRRPLGFGEPREHRQRLVAHAGLETTTGHQVTHFGVGSVRVVVMVTGVVIVCAVDVELRGRDTAPFDAFAGQRHTPQPDRLYRRFDGTEWYTEVEQRADGHVATDAGERIEVRNAHGVETSVERCAPRGPVVLLYG